MSLPFGFSLLNVYFTFCFFSYFVRFWNCLSFRISWGFWNMRLCLCVECYTTLKKQLSTHLHDFISDWQLVTLSEQVTVEATNSSPQPLRGEATASSKSVLGKFEFQKFLQWNIGCLDLHYRVERSWHVLPIEEKNQTLSEVNRFAFDYRHERDCNNQKIWRGLLLSSLLVAWCV